MQQPTRSVEVNSLAVVSFAFGVLAYVALPLVGALLAIFFGWLARRQIISGNGTGLGLARAGSILGGLWFVTAMLLLLVLLMASSH